ncbi:MAG: type II toxin-antitoxin system YafQ family toxin [Bacteroidales bacterium]|nr:type II toxin-antitoxin system YafQ family toxin [Bacteroidales bacterium]
MMNIVFSNKYKKAYKLAKKRGLDVSLLNDVVRQLAEGISLDPKYKDHQLSGTYKAYRECHIQFDWVLVYRIVRNRCELYLYDTGTHEDVF